MKKCDCYHLQPATRYTYHPLTGRPIAHDVEIGVCWGTRECDECSCGGDQTKCDFYPEVREKAKKEVEKIITNADWIRTMTDDELADAIDKVTNTGACNDFGITPERECDSDCIECIKEWLKQPVKE